MDFVCVAYEIGDPWTVCQKDTIYNLIKPGCVIATGVHSPLETLTDLFMIEVYSDGIEYLGTPLNFEQYETIYLSEWMTYPFTLFDWVMVFKSYSRGLS